MEIKYDMTSVGPDAYMPPPDPNDYTKVEIKSDKMAFCVCVPRLLRYVMNNNEINL